MWLDYNNISKNTENDQRDDLDTKKQRDGIIFCNQ